MKNKDLIFFFSRFKDSFFYFGAAIISLPISIFTSPLFAKNLSSYDYSAIGYFSAITQFFLPFVTMSFYSFFMIDYHKRSDSEKQHVLRTLVSFLFIMDIPIVILGYFVLKFYLQTSNSMFSAFPLGLIVILSTTFAIGQGFWLLSLRFERKAKQYLLISVLYTLLNTGLGLYLVMFEKMGALGKLLPALLLQMIIYIVFFSKYIKKFTFDLKIIKLAFLFCLPIFLEAFLNLPVLSLDKILLERVQNIKEFALYNIGFSFSGYIFSFGSAILMAFEPDIFEYTGKKDKKQLIKMFIVFVLILCIVDILFFAVSKPVINFLTAGRYNGARKYANLLIISQSMILVVYFLGYILTALKLTRIQPLIKIVVSVISIGLLILLISKFEFIGAIYSKYITYLFWIILILFFINFRRHKYVKHFYVSIAKQ